MAILTQRKITRQTMQSICLTIYADGDISIMLDIEYTMNTGTKGKQRESSKFNAVVISTLAMIGLSRRSVYQVASRKMKDRLIRPQSFICRYIRGMLNINKAQKWSKRTLKLAILFSTYKVSSKIDTARHTSTSKWQLNIAQLFTVAISLITYSSIYFVV